MLQQIVKMLLSCPTAHNVPVEHTGVKLSGVLPQNFLKSCGRYCFLVLPECEALFYTNYLLNFTTNKSQNVGPCTTDNYVVTRNTLQCIRTCMCHVRCSRILLEITGLPFFFSYLSKKWAQDVVHVSGSINCTDLNVRSSYPVYIYHTPSTYFFVMKRKIINK
jgi:hypothetical protein